MTLVLPFLTSLCVAIVGLGLGEDRTSFRGNKKYISTD